jgi:hypothetical protein
VCGKGLQAAEQTPFTGFGLRDHRIGCRITKLPDGADPIMFLVSICARTCAGRRDQASWSTATFKNLNRGVLSRRQHEHP